jgi:hypothetical protein
MDTILSFERAVRFNLGGRQKQHNKITFAAFEVLKFGCDAA